MDLGLNPGILEVVVQETLGGGEEGPGHMVTNMDFARLKNKFP